MSPQNNPTGYCNDIFQNVYLRPYYNKEKELLDWGYSMSEYPSILDILGNLQLVKNAPRKSNFPLSIWRKFFCCYVDIYFY